MLVNLGQRNPFHPLLTPDLYHRVAQLQRDAEVVQALDNVSFQAAGVRHQLRNHLDLGSFQRHTPCHNQADIAGAQNHYLAAGHVAFHIDKPLGRACGEDARRTVAGDIQRASGTLSAAHGQNHGLRLNPEHALFPVHGRHNLFMADIHNHSVQPVLDAQFLHLVDKPPRILRAGQFLLKGMKPKAIVDTLV